MKFLTNQLRSFMLLSIALCVHAGCATNAVTGKKQLKLVSEQQELQIGAQQYVPSQQSQGGVYTLDPQLTRYISSVGQKLAAVSDRKLPYEFVVLNNSVPNAWALPGGKIAINRGLLIEMKSEAELAAVLGHELVHSAAGHGAQQMQRGMLAQGAVGIGSVIAESKSEGSGRTVQQLGGLGAGLTLMKYGRDAERESDEYGIKYMVKSGYDPSAAVEMQETLLRLSGQKKADFAAGLFSSHPLSQERIANNKETLKKYPEGGFRGEKKYRQKIARLLKTQKAYDNYDAGVAALAKGNIEGALSLARSAQHIEPKEAHFYALSAEAYLVSKQVEKAHVEINKALELNPKFFKYHLIDGVIHEKQRDRKGAKGAYKRSFNLLQTKAAAEGYRRVQ